MKKTAVWLGIFTGCLWAAFALIFLGINSRGAAGAALFGGSIILISLISLRFQFFGATVFLGGGALMLLMAADAKLALLGKVLLFLTLPLPLLTAGTMLFVSREK